MKKLMPLFLSILLTGCMSSNRYTLTPLGDGVRWHRGQAIQKVEGGDFIATATYLRSEDGNLLFSISVKNTGDEETLLDPGAFRYEILVAADQARGTTRTAGFPESQTGPVPAIDPETRIDRLEWQRQLQRDSESSMAMLELIDSVIELADIGDPETEEEAAERRDEEARERRRQMEQRQREIRNRRKLAFWGAEALRKTTLSPGESMGGVVVFPGRTRAQRIRLVLPLGETRLAFEFDQTRL